MTQWRCAGEGERKDRGERREREKGRREREKGRREGEGRDKR